MALLGGANGGMAPQGGADPRLAAMQAMQGADPRARMASAQNGQPGGLPGPQGSSRPAAMQASSMGDGVDETIGEDASILDMIQKAISGTDASQESEGPSKEELQELIDNPTDGNINSFIETYGREALPAEMQNPDPDAPDYADGDSAEEEYQERRK